MLPYILRCLLPIVLILFGILLINFIITQAAPGGPAEQVVAKLEGFDAASGGVTGRISGGDGEAAVAGSQYRDAQGLSPELVEKIERMYGFGKSTSERFMIILENYLHLGLEQSSFRDVKVTDLVIEKLPVSISLGPRNTLIVYLASIPLGIAKAARHGSVFDTWISSAIIVGYVIPIFLFAILLVVLFTGGDYQDWFPLRGLTSNNFDQLSLGGKVFDYSWHLASPVTAPVIDNFATIMLLIKNSLFGEIGKRYMVAVRAKGLIERHVLYGHVFHNAMLSVIASLPAALLGIFFTGSLLIEVIFSLNGLGLFSFEAVMDRDYPVVLNILFILTPFGLVMKLTGDIVYTLVNPHIGFENRE